MYLLTTFPWSFTALSSHSCISTGVCRPHLWLLLLLQLLLITLWLPNRHCAHCMKCFIARVSSIISLFPISLPSRHYLKYRAISSRHRWIRWNILVNSSLGILQLLTCSCGEVVLNENTSNAYIIQSKTFFYSICNSTQYIFSNHGYVPGTLLDASGLTVKTRTQSPYSEHRA